MSYVSENKAAGWPDSLLNAAWSGIIQRPKELSADIHETVEIVVDMLKKREQSVIRMRFRDGLTLEECGIEMDLTHERVRQIEMQAVQRLREPKLNMILSLGISRHTEVMKTIRMENEREWGRMFRNAEKAIARLSEEGFDPTIDCLGLSHSVSSRLRRGGVSTLEELCSKTFSDLYRINGFGSNSANEVKAALDMYGLRLQPDPRHPW